MAGMVIPTYFTAIDKFTLPLAKMKAGIISFGHEITAQQAEAAMALNATAASAQQLAMTAGAAAAAIIVPLGLATKAAMDFQDQMASVSTIVDTTKESMSQMSDEVLNMASKMPVKLNDVTDALYYIRSAGVDAANAMDVLATSNKLAVAGLSTSTEAAKAVTSAMVAFQQQGMTTEQIANSFFLTVREGKTKMDALNESFGSTGLIVANAGVKLQEFNAATAAMTNAGFTASEAQTAIRGAVIAMIKPTGEMVDVLESMGYVGSDAGTQLIKKMGGVVPAMEAIKNAAGATGDNINKAFGRVQGLNALIALLGNQHQSFLANLDEQNKGVSALEEAYGKKMATAAAQSQIFMNNLKQLGIIVGDALLPSFGLLIIVAKGIDSVFKSIAKNPIGAIFINLLAIAGGLLGVLSGLGIAIWAVSKAIMFAKSTTILFSTSLKYVFGVLKLFRALIMYDTLAVIGFVGAITLGIGAILLLSTAIGDIYTESNNAAESIDDLNKKFNQVPAALTPAQIAMEAYKDALKKVITQQNLLAKMHFAAEHGDWTGVVEYTVAAGLHSFWDTISMQDDMANPDPNKYFTPEQMNNPSVQNQIVLNVAVDKSGGVTLNGKPHTGGSISVERSSTR